MTSYVTDVTTWIFQFTPLREGRLICLFNKDSTGLFQFTPLREGRHCDRCAESKQARFQFTPLREGRHRALAGATTSE